MAEGRKKSSRTASLADTDSSDLGDSPLVPLRSFIPTHEENLEGFQIEDKTLLDPRSSVDSNLSYPSEEPSLLEQLRSGLTQGGIDVRKILNTKKSYRDMTINFSLASSPGSLNSTADITIPPERRRQANVLKRKPKNNMNFDFTLNDTASSCDNQENEIPALPINRPNPLFKKPSAKKMSFRFDDVSDSDTSRVSHHDDSLPALDPKSRKLPLRSSRLSGARDKNISFDISLDSSASSELSNIQAPLNEAEGSTSVSKDEIDHAHLSVSGIPCDPGPSQNSDNSHVDINDQTFTRDTKAKETINSVGLVVIPSDRHTDDQTIAAEVEPGKTCDPELDKTPPSNLIANNGGTLNNTFVVAAAPQESVNSFAQKDVLKSEVSPVRVNDVANLKGPDLPAPTASIQNLSTLTEGTEVPRKMSLRLLSKETNVDNTPASSERTGPHSEISNAVQLGQKLPSRSEKGLTGRSSDLTSSQLGEEPIKLHHLNKLKHKKSKFSVNFTLSDTTSNDSTITTPKVLGRNEALLRKKINNISVAIQPDDSDTLNSTRSNTNRSDGIEDKLGADRDDGSVVDFDSSSSHGSGDEGNDGDSTSHLPTSGKSSNLLKGRRLERNKISIPWKLEDTVPDGEFSDTHWESSTVSTSKDPSVVNENLEDVPEETSEVAPNVTHSSDAVSLGCSLDDMPRSSDDYGSDSFKSCRKISVLPHETSNVAKERSPSIDGHSEIACSPKSGDSLDELHLELSLNGSLEYSGMGSNASDVKVAGKGELLKNSSSSGVDGAQTANVLNRSLSMETHSNSSVLTAKNPAVLRRSKRGSKNVTDEVDLSSFKHSVCDVSTLARKAYKNPLNAKTRLNKISIAFSDETNESCFSETDKEAFCGSPTEVRHFPTPQTRQSIPEPDGVEVMDIITSEAGQNQNELQNNKTCSEVQLSCDASIQKHLSDVGGGAAAKMGIVNGLEVATELNGISNESAPNISRTQSKQNLSPKTGKFDDGLLVKDGTKLVGVTPTLQISEPQMVRSTRTSPKTSAYNNEMSTRSPAATNGDMNEGIQHVVVTPNLSYGLAEPSVDQLRSSLEQPLPAHCNIREPSPCITPAPVLDNQELPLDASQNTIPAAVHQLTNVSPAVPIEAEAVDDVVASLHPNEPVSHLTTNDGKSSSGGNSCPPAAQTIQTTASSLHLQLTTIDTEVGDVTNIKSLVTVTRMSPIHEATCPAVEPVSMNTKPVPEVMKAIEKSEISGIPQPPNGITPRNTEGSNSQKESSNSEIPLTEKQNAFVSNPTVPKPALKKEEQMPNVEQSDDQEPLTSGSVVVRTDHSVTPGKEDPPEPTLLRKSKRKSVSFKPPTENLYHSPPDHGSFQHQDQNADNGTQIDNGYEFSRIQMTTDISEIQPSPSTKKPKRHFSSTPISKPKRPVSPSKPDDLMPQPQPVANAQPRNHQFLVPSVVPVTKRVSIQPVPEIITSLRCNLPCEPGPTTEAGPGSSEGGSGTSSYDLSCENSLELSAIPKEPAAPKWGNLFHSTPLHQTKASMKKMRKKSREAPPVPQVGDPITEKGPDVQVVSHSVQTSHNLRSQSKTSSESSSASEHPSQGTSASRPLRRSARRNQTPSAAAAQTSQAQGDEPVDGSPANRIAIQDNTILSTRRESHSRNKSSRNRSTTGSSFKSYDSHHKMTSRRLFNDLDQNRSSTDTVLPSEMAESSPPKSADFPPSSTDIASTSQQDDAPLSPAETSIARSYQPSIPQTDENVSLISGHPEDVSDNESVVSSVSTGSSGSIPSHVVLRQSFESQLSSLRHRSDRRPGERAGSHPKAPEVPKPRSKFAVPRPDPNADLNLIYPVDVPVKKRKRTQSATIKLYNPGHKWKKSKLLYAWLKKKLAPIYKLRTNLESERLVIELERAQNLISLGHTQGALDLAVERLINLKICTNQLQLWAFFMKFMPFEFVRDVVPLGGAFGKPFDLSQSFSPYDPV